MCVFSSPYPSLSRPSSNSVSYIHSFYFVIRTYTCSSCCMRTFAHMHVSCALYVASFVIDHENQSMLLLFTWLLSMCMRMPHTYFVMKLMSCPYHIMHYATLCHAHARLSAPSRSSCSSLRLRRMIWQACQMPLDSDADTQHCHTSRLACKWESTSNSHVNVEWCVKWCVKWCVNWESSQSHARFNNMSSKMSMQSQVRVD